MTDQEVMKLALDALENIIDAVYVNSDQEAIAVKHANIVITALKEALAQPEQEPVAWICEGSSSDEKHAIDYWQGDVDDLPIGTQLYTTPPQRTEPLIGCVNHDCAKCKEQQVERNFCPRCGKRTKDLTHIHTCTPPKD